MADKEPKPTTWPWIITACLLPLVVAALLTLGWLSNERKRLANEVEVSLTQFEEQAVAHKTLTDTMQDLVAKSGIGTWNPDTKVEAIAEQKIPVPPEERTPMMNAFSETSMRIWNSADNSVSKMRAQTQVVDQWHKDLQAHLAYMIYGPESQPQYFSVGSFFNAAAAGALTEEDQIQRLVNNLEMLKRPEVPAGSTGGVAQADLNRAYGLYRRGERTADPRVSVAANPTIESLIMLNRTLIDTLSAYSDDAAHVLWGETDGGDGWRDQANNLKTNVGTPENASDSGTDAMSKIISGTDSVDGEVLQDTRRALDGGQRDWENVSRDLSDQRELFATDMETLRLDYENIINGANRDKRLLMQLLKENRKLTEDYPTIRWDQRPDGELSYVNNDMRVCHINMGEASNIQRGMRFEVWRFQGARGSDQRIGMIEVLRTLGDYHALCVILEEPAESGVGEVELREGDAIINRLWDNGSYLKVSLAGTRWGGTDTFYGKDRLTKLLQGMGVLVQDDIAIDTQLVILGQGRRPDRAYQDARDTIAFEEMTADAVRLYVDPR